MSAKVSYEVRQAADRLSPSGLSIHITSISAVAEYRAWNDGGVAEGENETGCDIGIGVAFLRRTQISRSK